MLNSTHFLNSLNTAQLEAVNHLAGPMLILAGAGTGKTKVLTSRVANIIYQGLAEPSNILAVTFTNKAAKEMGERIGSMIDAYGLNVGTFHSIAARMLRIHAASLNIGLTSNFTIIDPDDQIKLVKNIALAQNVDVKSHSPKLIQIIIARWKDLGLLPNKISNLETNSSIQRIAKSVYKEYQVQLLASNAVDFGDLLLYNTELFINVPEILKHYQNKYKYILIDEYQDTNTIQYLWASMLASGWRNICCVGDDDQSIYSWRGAEVGNILRFEQDFPNSKIIKLEQNYRSSSEILLAASNLISNNKNRHGKTLWTDRSGGEKIKIISCWNDKEEARFIVSEIEKLINGNKYSAGQAAILVRAGFQTRAFEEAFISNALPYKIIGGLRFYERMEIRDVLAYIRISLNPNDNLALERIINVPKRSIGNSTLKQIKDYAAEHGTPILEGIKSMLEAGSFKGKVKDNISKLVLQINDWHNRYQTQSALEVTQSILDDSTYLEILRLEKTDESRGRIENINEMLRAISEFDDIQDFVQHASLVMENDTLEANFGGAVSIMTLHAAKGLEFELVFLPGWEEGVFPHQKALQEEGDKGLEEERRIAYVGITRAKKELYISFAESRRIFNEISYSNQSRFLAEIPREVCIEAPSSRKLNYSSSRFFFQPSNEKFSPVNSISTFPVARKDPSDLIAVGSKVRHPKFGSGIVIRRNDDNLEIIFDNKVGLKTIKRSYVEQDK